MTDETARPEEAAAPAPAEADPAAKAAQEVADLKDRLLRALAEMENLRRRTEREVADTRLYSVTGFARDVVGVADNIQRALDAIGAEQRADPAANALIEGFELTQRELHKALEKHGIKRFEPQGQKFDPNLHQAIFEVPDPAVPAGNIAQVVQAGYTIGERVLRPAMVGVSKGAARMAPQAVPANDD